MTDQYLPQPIGWLMRTVGLPMASAQVGTNLSAFSPADQARRLWPRPILVVHGMDDELVGFNHGQELFDAAFQPKFEMWIRRGGQSDILNSDSAAKTVKRYFDSAGSVL